MHFIICHAANRPSWLFSNLLHHKNVKPEDNKTIAISNGKVAAITYHAVKKDKSHKLVNFTTNFPQLLNTDSGIGKKPPVVTTYNKHKGYVDLLASQMGTYKFAHRTKRLWKHKFIVLLFLMVHNSFKLWHFSAANLEAQGKQTMAVFLDLLVDQMRHPAAMSVQPLRPDSTAIYLHRAAAFGKNSQGRSERHRCFLCGSKTAYGCRQCSADKNSLVLICQTSTCWLRQHIPNFDQVCTQLLTEK